MDKKIDAEKELVRLLQIEINNCVDDELTKMIKDPNYKSDLEPIIFKSEEDKQAYIAMIKRNLEG
jgi:hypothetical protein